VKTYEFETKTLDRAKQIAAETLRVNPNNLEIEVLEKTGLLVKSYKVRASVNVDPVQLGFETLKQVFKDMRIDANIEMRRKSDQETHFTIHSKENPILIGKNGKTLDSIQYYVRNLVNLYSQDPNMVLVDIGGYKENRKRQLEILATKTAKQVAKTKVEAKLQPMNAYERRIIHTKLAEWRDVTTESEGEGSNRRLVIKPTRK
jgi:spoIIIJ-associated protein